MFQVSIQFGAILAVVVFYWKKFFDFKNFNFYLKISLGIVPALVLGKLFDDKIEAVLEKPLPIAIVLVIGGIILLFVDKLFKAPTIHSEKEVGILQAIKIGLWQCLAMMPGTSRSAASIIGGMQQKLTRDVAAEFSFFLAVPTMLAVTLYSIFFKDWRVNAIPTKGYEMIMATSDNIQMFAIGNIVAFVVALIAIKFFIGFLKKHGFKVWGWYRIIVGCILLLLIYIGYIK